MVSAATRNASRFCTGSSSETQKCRWERNKRGRLRFKIGQEEMFPRLLATGAFAAIETAYSVDEALDWIERWGIPMRGRIMV
jgi:hypothetical protein